MLYVCPTPIGNLGDITLRVVEVLRQVDLVACEDTRRTGRLLEHFEIRKELVSFFEHNELRRLGYLLGQLRDGRSVALVSDAGMPGLSDPGFTLIRAAIDEGIEVIALPGASAITVALVSSGLPPDRFTFAGFVPRGGRGRILAFLEEAGRAGGTLVVFDSPHRVRGTLAAVAERWPDRLLALCRELTKLHEEIVRGTAEEILERLADTVRGEIVLVLGPAKDASGEGGAEAGGIQEKQAEALKTLLARGWGAREAASLVSELTGAPLRRIYNQALGLSRERS